MTGEYTKTLFQIFDVLGLSDDEKPRALDIFKKKVAAEVLRIVQGQLPEEQQSWIAGHLQFQPDPADPKVLEIKNKIGELFSETQLSDITRIAFKKLVKEYIDFMSDGLDADRVSKINAIAEGI